MTETRNVSGRIAFLISSTDTTPCVSTGIRVTSTPFFSIMFAVSITEECSIAEIIRCGFAKPLRCAARAAPSRARPFASVPPEVNTISSGNAWRISATFLRASARTFRAATPSAYKDEGLAYFIPEYFLDSRKTRGSIGVSEA